MNIFLLQVNQTPPTNKNTYPTRPTDNPINPIRNCNPKIHLTPNKNKYQNKY